MASRSLGTLTLDLVAKTGGFTAGMTAAERQAAKSMAAIEKRAYAFGKALGTGLRVAGVAAAAAVTGIAALTKAAIDNADALRDTSIQLGISTEILSGYGYAASQTGTDLDTLARGLKILAKNSADALKSTSEQARIFEALGISVTDAQGELRKLDDILPEIADALQGMENGTLKASLMLQLFGKSGLELTELLSGGSEGLDEFARKARELGLEVGTNTANAADNFNDVLGDLKAQVSGLGLSVASDLLPTLIDTTESLSQLIKEGNLAANMAAVLSGALNLGVAVLDQYNNAVERTSIAMGILAASGAAAENAIKGGIAGQLLAIKQVNAALGEGQRQLDALIKRQNSPFRVTATVDTTYGADSDVNSAALQKALGGIGGTKAKAAKAAAKEVDKLDESYKRLLASMKEEVALFGQTTEAAKLLYDLQNGELAALAEPKKQELLALAQKIDAMKEMAELEEAAAEANKQESKRLRDALEDNESLIDAMRFEYELLGMTNKEREREYALRQLNVGATEEQKQAVLELADAYTEMQETISVMDDIRGEFQNFFSDVLTGTKSVKDAFKDMLDDIQKRILDRIAQNWVDQLFGQQGTSGQGTSGGGWLNFISSFFGGGKASGGSVMPGKFYQVNENGPEMLSVSGKDYLMMGPNSGKVTPNHKLGGGPAVGQINFYTQGRLDRRTAAQQASEAGRKVAQAQARGIS